MLKKLRKKTNIILVPGQKLCGNCMQHLFGGDDFSESTLVPETSLKEGREYEGWQHCRKGSVAVRCSSVVFHAHTKTKRS
jgi:hypothetical protein